MLADQRIVKRLNQEARKRFGERWSDRYDIRWDRDEHCLAIYERAFNERWRMVYPIRNDDRTPRQADERDVQALITNRIAHQDQLDAYFKGKKDKADSERAQQLAHRREFCGEMAKEMWRYLRCGRTGVLMGNKPESDGAVKVIDKRRSFEEAS